MDLFDSIRWGGLGLGQLGWVPAPYGNGALKYYLFKFAKVTILLYFG